MVFLVVIGLAMAILAVLFAFQNSTLVTISFGAWQFEESLAIVLIVTLGLGIIISLLLSLPTIIKRGWHNSQQKKKIAELEFQLKEQQKIQSQSESTSFAKQLATGELLQVFELSDRVTGLLTKDAAIKVTDWLLQQIRDRPNTPRYSSLFVALLAVEPEKSQLHFADVGSENAVYKAIAKRFKNAAIPDSFLGITERKRLICLVLGLKGKEIAEYGNYLQEKISESPLQKADGTSLPLKVSLGGVVVDPTDTLDSRSIFKQAEQNLDVSANKNRKTPEITEITTKTL